MLTATLYNRRVQKIALSGFIKVFGEGSEAGQGCGWWGGKVGVLE